jgi:hypothetical protein
VRKVLEQVRAGFEERLYEDFPYFWRYLRGAATPEPRSR